MEPEAKRNSGHVTALCHCPCQAHIKLAPILHHFWTSLVDRKPLANARDVRDSTLIPERGRSPGEGMAPHSSILAWRIPWTEEPGRLQSAGSQRVRNDDWSDWACAHTHKTPPPCNNDINRWEKFVSGYLGNFPQGQNKYGGARNGT